MYFIHHEDGDAKINLGDTVADKITGFEGIVTGICAYLYGCIWIEVTSTELGENNKPEPGLWFDAARFDSVDPNEELVEAEEMDELPTPTRLRGGPGAPVGARPNLPMDESRWGDKNG